jgi:hypothetical protein
MQEWLNCVDFLEQCRERLEGLINVGSSGLLREDVFARCLDVNDAVIKALAGESPTVS